MLVKITVIPLIITMVVMIMMMMAVTTVLPTQPPTQPTAGKRGWVGGGECTQLWLLLRPLPLPNDLSIASSWNESNQHSRREEGAGDGVGVGWEGERCEFPQGELKSTATVNTNDVIRSSLSYSGQPITGERGGAEGLTSLHASHGHQFSLYFSLDYS